MVPIIAKKSENKQPGGIMQSKFTRIMCCFMAFSLLMLNVSVPMAKAEMISTERSIAITQGAED